MAASPDRCNRSHRVNLFAVVKEFVAARYRPIGGGWRGVVGNSG
jgi:hypothetical protein